MDLSVKEKLKNLVEDEYVRIQYTRESHIKCAHRLEKTATILSILQIVLSAVSTAGLISVLIADNKYGTIVGTVCSAAIFALSTYLKDKSFLSDSKKHMETAEKLFQLREEYALLLATIDNKNEDEIEAKHSDLFNRTTDVYSSALKYSPNDYDEAVKAIGAGKVSVSKEDRKTVLPVFEDSNEIK